MLQYLVVLLDDKSISFCNYTNKKEKANLMPYDILEKTILFGLKENLMFQFVYPDFPIPNEYETLIKKTDHTKIKSYELPQNDTDLVVIDNISRLNHIKGYDDKLYIIKCSPEDIGSYLNDITKFMEKTLRLNFIIETPTPFSKDIQDIYKINLEKLSDNINKMTQKNKMCQINILTDRLFLKEMNNCGAGMTSITVGPDGRFYVCPAFYQAVVTGIEKMELGNVEDGLIIKNQRLYQLEFAPICRKCDAYHCKRCIWKNKQATYEVNTPGKNQCITSHLERNASAYLLKKLKEHSSSFNQVVLNIEDCLDPFEKLIRH